METGLNLHAYFSDYHWMSITKDQYIKTDPPDKKMVQRMEQAISQSLKKSLATKKALSIGSLVATSGMAGNLAEIIYLARTGRALSQIDMAVIHLNEINPKFLVGGVGDHKRG